MNAIEISLDYTMFATGSSIGDSLWRHRQYATVLGRLSCVVYSLRRRRNSDVRAGEGLTLYPTQSLTRLSLPLDAYRVGAQIMRSEGADFLMTQDPFATGLAGYLLKRRFGIPLNVMVFSSFFDNPDWLRERAENRFLHVIGKFVVRHADTVRVESLVERDKLVALGVEERRVWTIPLLVDLSRFAAADGRAIRERYAGQKIVLFAGRLAPEKNVDKLIQAMCRLAATIPEAVLLVVGDGPEREHLERLARALNASVHFVGVVQRERLPEYFAAADVIALPSLYEGIPTVLIEAAATGRPVVATPTRNISDVLEDGVTGFVVDAEPSAFAARLAVLLTDPERQRSFGMAARELAFKRFDPKRTLTRLADMWDATVHDVPAARDRD